MLLDTHIHLDAAEYGGQAPSLAAQARSEGVTGWVIPAVAPFNFATVKNTAYAIEGAYYALGIHPMYVDPLGDEALAQLEAALEVAASDKKCVAVGEIGLDYFLPNLDRDKQMRFYMAQLKLAKKFDLPVILHVRRSQDMILKGLRQIKPRGGIAHSFNGSAAQARVFYELGFKLGFGGAATFTRALQIRERLREVPDDGFVLETDGPDIAPTFLPSHSINPPASLAGIAANLALVRGEDLISFKAKAWQNSLNALPKITADLAHA